MTSSVDPLGPPVRRNAAPDSATVIGGEDILWTAVGQIAWWAKYRPNFAAIRYKKHGIWKVITYRELLIDVRRAASLFQRLGVASGDRVAIHSDNRPEWIVYLLGAQAVGAVPFGIYPTSSAKEVGYLLRHSEARVLVVEGEEELDKLSDSRCTGVEHVIAFERREARGHTVLGVWEDLLSAASPADSFAQVDPDDVALMVYTSGTTGPPKGAMLSYRNAAAMSKSFGDEINTGPDDLLLSYLPLNHIAEQVVTVYMGLCRGVSVCFAESVQSVQSDLSEVRPTVFAAVPRVLEKLVASIDVSIARTGSTRRWAYRAACRTADAPLIGFVARVVLRQVARQLGLGNVRLAMSAGAPIGSDVINQLRRLGVPLIEGYGLTETMGLVVMSPQHHPVEGTVGRPIEGVEVRIHNDGEILIRGEPVFLGYFRDEVATASTIDGDGWLHTGDLGCWVGGDETHGPWDGKAHLKIVGRIKDIIITSGGKNISPAEVENAVRSSPFIRNVVVIGDARPYVAALIEIEEDLVAEWAQNEGVVHTTFRQLTELDEVRKLISKEVTAGNEALARVEQIRNFFLLPRPLDIDLNELTPTQKVRRKVVEEHFQDIVEELYKGGSQ